MGAACTKVAKAAVKQQMGDDKKKEKQAPPTVDSVIYLPSYGVIGKVTSVEDNGRIMLQELTPAAEESRYDPKGWQLANEVEELKNFFPHFEVTATCRGAQVNGWVVDVKEEGKVYVKFKPDAAHDRVDKTHWTLGEREAFDVSAVTHGHSGEERPRNRNADEIAAKKSQVKGFGVANIHCCRCGRGIWEDPCDCYVSRSVSTWACAQCGKKGGKQSVCCGKRLGAHGQNQGYPNVLGRQYGHFE